MTLTHGSLFSGVGGMDLGFDAAGIETLWQCEIDAKPRSVLAKHWSNATRYVDVKDVDGSQVKPVDIISFGSPCQDLSVAGKRAGLTGARSGLYHQAIRVIKEMRDATQNQYPKVAIWENVRGALSSNEGKDFLAAIQELAAIGGMVSWRVVNACNFGVPQRRVRVFVVATFGDERAGEILSKPTRLLWHPPQGQEKETKTSRKTASQTTKGSWGTERTIVDALTLGGWYDTQEACAGRLVYALKKDKVRRLTPRECERLMGWPDDHTRYDDKGNELSDSARYKMCGNGIASPVAQWIGENIVEAYNA